jgi:hypothetical protein
MSNDAMLDSTRSLVSQLGALLPLDSRGRAVVSGLLAAESAYHRVHAIHEAWRKRQAYTVRISSNDDLYTAVQDWLLELAPPSERRSLIARTERIASAPDEDESGAIEAGLAMGRLSSVTVNDVVRYACDERQRVRFEIGRHAVEAAVSEPRELRSTRDYASTLIRVVEPEITLTAHSRAGLEAIQSELGLLAQRQAQADRAYQPMILRPTSYGWYKTGRKVTRDPSTVVLAAGQMELLLADLDQFLANEERYARIGSPWHRGYLLYGPAGTGKTSTAQALAAHHGMDLYYLLLSDVTSDEHMLGLVGKIRPRSLLVIEDIDCARSTHDRSAEADTRESVAEEAIRAMISKKAASTLTLQGILAALDGATTPHGMVTVMTTNHKDRLDPALLRSGRCDVVEEIGYLTTEQAGRMIEVMTDAPAPIPPIDGRRLTASDLSEVVKRNITDLDLARREVVRYLAGAAQGAGQVGLVTAGGGR